MKKIKTKQIILIAAALIIGFTVAKLTGGNEKASAETHEHQVSGDKKGTIWTCSMHPQIRMDKPGKCPICGMTLIPLETASSEAQVDPNAVQMTESAMKLAEVQTYIVKKGAPDKSLYLLGKVALDERNIAELTARFGGRIEKLYVNFTGQNVEKGEKLASVYSPEMLTAERELIEAVKYKESNPSFYYATRSKLKLWDLTDAQIDAIEKKGQPTEYFDILSPIKGTVMRRDVAVGDYIKEGQALFEVVDLSKVWVMFDAYESDLPWIKEGDKINFTVQSLPGEQFSGKVKFIDPFINPDTRVAKVRVEISNPGNKLKPEMFANGILESRVAENTDAVLIPETAVLWTGKRSVVYVKTPGVEAPSFVYREVVLGPKSGKFYVVAEGLKEGEEIAMNGVFKIDAAAQLAGKPSMMNPSGGKISTGHNHGGKTMTDEEMKAMNDKDNDEGSEKMPDMEKQENTKAEKAQEPESEMKCAAGKCGNGK